MEITIDIPEDTTGELHVLFVRSGKAVRCRITKEGIEYLWGHPEFLFEEMIRAFDEAGRGK